MENNIKCSLKKHQENDAISYCPECNIYICNKCASHHSELFENHNNYKLDKNIQEIFSGICKEPNHKNELEFYCKNHNILCCGACLSKIKIKGNGQHHDCNVCSIEDIKNDKKNKLTENIKYLEDISKNIENSINQLKDILKNINQNKEELKKKISTIFTRLRNVINDKEDEVLLEIDNIYSESFFKEDLIKQSEKLPHQIKFILEKGKLLDKEWYSDKYKLNYKVNHCINIENNIKKIIEINKNVDKYNNNKIKINVKSEKDEEINELIKNIQNFGKELFVKFDDILKSDIVTLLDIDFIVKKLNPDNKSISFKLIYKCKEDNDTSEKFHELCDGKQNVIMFIETIENIKFGGFTSVGFNSISKKTKDNKSFLFSIDKNKIYNVKKDKEAIYCFKGFGPCFCGTSDFNIYIYENNFLKNTHHTSPCSGNSFEINSDYELNNSKYKFLI